MLYRCFALGCCVLFLSSGVSRAGTLVQFRTTVGDFDVELYDADKPVTTRNFLRYITNGLYADSIMHRVVTNFVIQGGAVARINRGSTNGAFYSVPTFSPIANEFKVGKFYSNRYGTIAMAKTSDPDSATSSFFFNLTNNSTSLDSTNNSGGFTVFGHVVFGTNALNAFKIGPTNHLVKLVNLSSISPVLSECPVRYSATNVIHDSDLIYVDISLLSVQIVAPPNGGAREISWNSVSNKLNLVEYTTHLPPAWQILASTNGNGNRLKVTDASTGDPFRFYRVRVAY